MRALERQPSVQEQSLDQLAQFLQRRGPIALDGCATHFAFAHGVQRVSLNHFARQGKAEHLLQVRQQDIRRAQLALDLHHVKQVQQVAPRHIFDSPIANPWEDTSLELSAAEGAAILATEAASIGTGSWRQVDGDPFLEELSHGHPTLRGQPSVYFFLAVGLNATVSLGSRIDAVRPHGPQPLGLRASCRQRLVRVDTERIVREEPVPLLGLRRRIGQPKYPMQGRVALAQLEPTTVMQR